MNNNELTLEELMAEYEMLGEKIKQKKQELFSIQLRIGERNYI